MFTANLQTAFSAYPVHCLFQLIHIQKVDRHQLSQFVNQGCKDYKRMHEKQHSYNDTEYHNDAIFTSLSIKKRSKQPESSIKALVDSDLKFDTILTDCIRRSHSERSLEKTTAEECYIHSSS